MSTFPNDRCIFCFLYSTGVAVPSLSWLLPGQTHSQYPKLIQQLTAIFWFNILCFVILPFPTCSFICLDWGSSSSPAATCCGSFSSYIVDSCSCSFCSLYPSLLFLNNLIHRQAFSFLSVLRRTHSIPWTCLFLPKLKSLWCLYEWPTPTSVQYGQMELYFSS